MISILDFFSKGFPDNPPFSNLLIFFKFSLFLSVVFEIITAAILYLTRSSAICSILISSISGEIFTAIGISDFNACFYCCIAFNNSSNSFWLWKLLRFSVLGEEIFIVK